MSRIEHVSSGPGYIRLIIDDNIQRILPNTGSAPCCNNVRRFIELLNEVNELTLPSSSFDAKQLIGKTIDLGNSELTSILIE